MNPRDATVSLRVVDEDSRAEILSLEVAPEQRAFVATNAQSLAQAAEDEGAWARGIYADETAVGFVLLHDETLCARPRERGYLYLWRMMIDRRHQGHGYGTRALQQVFAYAKTRPDVARLHTSWRSETGNAGPFYRGLGFEPTGVVEDGEVHAARDL